MSDAKSLSELRDEWENGSETFLLATSCAAALAGPIERERRLMQLIQDIWDGYGRTADISVDCLERMEALVTPGAAQEGKGHGE